MRKSRQALSDTAVTRRAAVNPQYLQRHRDLKAEAETVRAHLALDGPRAAAAATSCKEAALEAENRMLLEQIAALQRTLQEVQSELRTLRADELGARIREGVDTRSLRDTEPQASDGPVRTRWYEAPTARHSLGSFATVHPDEPKSVTVVAALYHPTLGAAIGIGVVVVTLLNELTGR